MIRYAIIGTGWITESMIQGVRAVCPDKMWLEAVYSRTEEAAKAFIDGLRSRGAIGEGHPVRILTDLESLAADPQIDAVYIASPNRFHVEQSRRMLEAGKHVLCEKPIALFPEELAGLTELSREKGLVYMEAIMMLHQPQLADLQKAVSGLGNVFTAHMDFSQLSSKYPAYLAGKNPNIFNPAFGTGAFEDLGIYGIYLILELFGEPEEVRMNSRFLASGADAYGDALMIYPDKNVTFSFSKVGQSRGPSQVIGDESTLLIDSVSQLTGIRVVDRKGNVTEICGDETKPVLMGREANTFADLITGEKSREILEELQEKAMAVCRLMEKMRKIAGIHFPFEED